MSTYRAKLKRGGHSGGHLVLPDGTLAEEPLGGFNPGDVIESPVDLAKRYPEKFDPDNSRHNMDGSGDDGLEKMTVAQLQDLALDEEIELDGTERKAEIVMAIRVGRGVA